MFRNGELEEEEEGEFSESVENIWSNLTHKLDDEVMMENSGEFTFDIKNIKLIGGGKIGIDDGSSSIIDSSISIGNNNNSSSFDGYDTYENQFNSHLPSTNTTTTTSFGTSSSFDREPELENQLESSFEDIYSPQEIPEPTVMPDIPATTQFVPAPFSSASSRVPVPELHPMYNELGGYDPVILAGTQAFLMSSKELKLARYREKRERRQVVGVKTISNPKLSLEARMRARDSSGRWLSKEDELKVLRKKNRELEDKLSQMQNSPMNMQE